MFIFLNFMKNIVKIAIDSDEKSLLKVIKSKENPHIQNKEQMKSGSTSFFIYLIIILFCILLIFYFLYSLKKPILPKENKTKDFKGVNEIFNDSIIEPYIKSQKDFCENPNKYINQKYEDEIFLHDVKINELKYKMYIFKSTNFILNEFNLYGAYEVPLSNNIIKALKFYGENKNISNNKDIFMLDIGGNIGWYPSLLGRYNYTILSFEPFERNYYVSKKNYCYLNNNSNVIIITKGLGSKEKKCHYFNQLNNEGNGMVICDDNKQTLNDTGLQFIKDSDVEITTLDTFMPYLLNKKISLMKIDVEGYELEVLNGGKELINKYHVPFVTLEFSPTYLKEIGSDPRQLAQFFVDNGYKISLDVFLNKNYIGIDELLNKAGFQVNCYFIHDSIILQIP